VSSDQVDDSFAEADVALARGEHQRAASVIDQLVARRSLGDQDHRHLGDEFDRRLAAAEDLVRREPRERLLVFDSSAHVILYLRGTGSQVPLPTETDGRPSQRILHLLQGAHCVTHNHPVEPGRPIGGTLSLADIVLAQRFSISNLRVAAREATYSLTPVAGRSWDASSVARTQSAYLRMQAILNRAMGAPGRSAERDIYFYLRVIDFLMVQLSKSLSLRYARIDQPREDWSSNIPSPAGNVVEADGPTIIDDAEHFRWMSSVFQPGTA
jgi:hypothetical protein